jgi:hypothetical protein
MGSSAPARITTSAMTICAPDRAAMMRAGGWKSVNVLARYLEQAEHNVWA